MDRKTSRSPFSSLCEEFLMEMRCNIFEDLDQRGPGESSVVLICLRGDHFSSVVLMYLSREIILAL
jgi:hypothetical protein